MNKTILKLAAAAVASMVMASGTAFAQSTEPTCATADIASSATANRVNDFAGNPECYVVTPFKYNLSNGVALKATQNRNAIAVAASTPRGRNQFTGSSQGGSVATCGNPTTGNNEPTLDAPTVDAGKANGCNRS